MSGEGVIPGAIPATDKPSPFTPEQEARIREIITDAINAFDRDIGEAFAAYQSKASAARRIRIEGSLADSQAEAAQCSSPDPALSQVDRAS